MVAAGNERKRRLVLLSLVFEVCISVCAVESDTESGIVERISRRLSSDIYYFINSSSSSVTCGNENTYLISENKCVKDAELFRGNLIQ